MSDLKIEVIRQEVKAKSFVIPWNCTVEEDGTYTLMRMPWREYLDRVMSSDKEDPYLTLVRLNIYMQKHYPGPYKIIERMSSKRLCLEYALEFEDPHQETLWRLKYPE